jgi:hypothetical protein
MRERARGCRPAEDVLAYPLSCLFEQRSRSCIRHLRHHALLASTCNPVSRSTAASLRRSAASTDKNVDRAAECRHICRTAVSASKILFGNPLEATPQLTIMLT